MQAKQKKKTAIRRTTQPRAVRLQRAKVWLESYEGKKLVRGYAKKFKVDLLTAIAELKLLGVEIKPDYEQAVRQRVAQKIEENQKKKEVKLVKTEFDGISEYQDWDFAFIADYTSGGAPYGITWEEMDGLQPEV